MLTFVVIFYVLLSICQCSRPPHIIFIVADDLGWNDLGFHNPDIISPTIDQFAHNGVIFNFSYTQPMCTPSRTAFMTGYYPFHTGLQHWVIDYWQPNYLEANYTILPQYLKKQGYATHMIGKWHLGFCDWKYTPTYRGFDTFYGFYHGSHGYFDHKWENALDMRDNKNVVDAKEIEGKYSTNLFAERAVKIIKNHDPNTPLFLYLAFQNVHFPLEVPEKYESMYSHIQDKDRRIYLGMVTAMDEAFSNVTKALEEKGIMDNLLLAFTSDNGGLYRFGANNQPLRGEKRTLWEGGTRAVSFAYSQTLLRKTQYTNNGMMHLVDWFSTFIDVAGIPQPAGIDGVSQWKMWSEGADSNRQELVYNIDDIQNNGAIRDTRYKLMLGNPIIYDWAPISKPTDQTCQKGEDCYEKENVQDIQLYDLIDDPNEKNNLASELPEVVERLKKRFDFYNSTARPARFSPNLHAAADPANFNGVWSPGWC